MEKFETGAIREDKSNKSRPGLISPYFIERLAFKLKNGAEIYPDRNWEKGLPDEATLDSLKRHLLAYEMSKWNGYSEHNKEEDHLSAIAFNLMVLIHNEEIKKLEKNVDNK